MPTGFLSGSSECEEMQSGRATRQTDLGSGSMFGVVRERAESRQGRWRQTDRQTDELWSKERMIQFAVPIKPRVEGNEMNKQGEDEGGTKLSCSKW